MDAAPAAGGYTLQKYPDYWGAAPIIDQIEIEIITDPTTQVLELERGNLDLITSVLPANLQTRLSTNSNIDMISYQTILESMMWVQKTGYFADLAARQALDPAINRQIIASSAYGAGATASQNIYPSSMPGGNVPLSPTTTTRANSPNMSRATRPLR